MSPAAPPPDPPATVEVVVVKAGRLPPPVGDDAYSSVSLGGAESVTVREVNGVYMTQDGKRILVFQKGPYLIFLSGPGNAPVNGLVSLGNTIQV